MADSGAAEGAVDEVVAEATPQEPAAPETAPPVNGPLFTIPEGAPDNSAPCQVRAGFATEAVRDAAGMAAHGCGTDADCTTAGLSLGCEGACSAAVHVDRKADFEAVRAEIDAHACAGYQEAGCPYATPRCMQPIPVCVEGRCELKN
jgi:hypothetical protein